VDSLRSPMWASNGCEGMFSVSGIPTWCGRAAGQPDADDICPHICAVPRPPQLSSPKDPVYCSKGAMPEAGSNCGVMLLTSFFTTKMDWQRLRFVKPTFKKIQILYSSALRRGLNVTMIYDQLPLSIVKKYGNVRFRFERINFDDFDKRLGINDVRYFFFNQLLNRYSEWRYVFLVDAFDVQVTANPCFGVKKGTLYVGSEKDKLQGHPWMKQRFAMMGGKYDRWYSGIGDKLHILNCGLLGGSRHMMLELFQHMMSVMLDPETTVSKKGVTINLNMAALNYIVYNRYNMSTQISTGMPFHSRYKMYEQERRDVWFVHK